MTRAAGTRSLSRRGLLGAAATMLPALLGAGPRRAAAQGSVPDDPTRGKRVIFEDGFSRLDTAVWHAGPKVSTSDAGLYGRSAFARLGGEEGFNPYAIVSDSLAGGGRALQISAKYIGRTMQVPNYYGNTNPEYQWISGNLQMARPDRTLSNGWRHGYFETRMRFPRHPLTWPAFWLLNRGALSVTNRAVEIDVVEHKGFEPRNYGAYLHEWGDPGERHRDGAVATGVDVTAGYNLYGVLLQDDLCAIYFNRKLCIDPVTRAPLVWTLERSAELQAGGDVFWPLITLALHHDVPYPDPLVSDQKSASMRVDYLRVYA